MPDGSVCLLDTTLLNTAQLPDHFIGDNHVSWVSEMMQSNLILNPGLKILNITQQVFIEAPKRNQSLREVSWGITEFLVLGNPMVIRQGVTSQREGKANEAQGCDKSWWNWEGMKVLQRLWTV